MLDRFVVTGSGRCGTTWMSRALTRAGVPCGHEAVFHPGEAVWPDHLRADSSWVAACRLGDVTDPVVLLVRHPLSVVKSLVEIGFFGWDLDNAYHEVLRAAFPHVYRWATPQDCALSMWLSLNESALTRAEMVLRMEQVTVDPELFGRFLSWAGGNPRRAEEALTEPPCNRHRESRQRTWITHRPVWATHDPDLARRSRTLARTLGYCDDDGEG